MLALSNYLSIVVVEVHPQHVQRRHQEEGVVELPHPFSAADFHLAQPHPLVEGDGACTIIPVENEYVEPHTYTYFVPVANARLTYIWRLYCFVIVPCCILYDTVGNKRIICILLLLIGYCVYK